MVGPKNSGAIRKSMSSLSKVDIFKIFVAFFSLVKIKTTLGLNGHLANMYPKIQCRVHLHPEVPAEKI